MVAGAGQADTGRLVRAFFTKHARAYGESRSHRYGDDLDRLVEMLAPRPGELALDVATAAGHTAFRLAALGARVVGVDLTEAMREPFLRLAGEQGLRGARFQVGDVQNLPFSGGSFDIVTSRRAPHHFPDVPRAIAEMARVLKPGGRLGVADMSPPEDREEAALFNRLERARDRSHVRACTGEEWREMVEAAGLRVGQMEFEVERVPWERWLYPVEPDGPEAARAEAVLKEADPRAAAAVVEDGEDGRRFLKRRVVLVAVQGASASIAGP